MAKRLLEILLEESLINRTQQRTVLYRQRLYGGKVGGHLLALGYLDAKQLSKALSIRYNIPEIDPDVLFNIDPKLIMEFPINLAKRYIALPLMKIKKTLSIVISDPTDKEALRKIRSETGMEIKPYVAPENLIKKFIMKYYKLPPSFMQTPEISKKPAEEPIDVSSNIYDYESNRNLEVFAPSSERVIEIPDKESRTNAKAATGKSVNSDPVVFDLISTDSFIKFAEKVNDHLFLGLNRIVFLEVNPDFLKPLAAKGWKIDEFPDDFCIFQTRPESINYYFLLQENYYYGPLKNIVSEELAHFLAEKPTSELDRYYSIFLVLTYFNKVYFLVYGDLEGYPIPEQYQKTWLEYLQRLEQALPHLLTGRE